ncbi:hypothetical protein RF11_09721 [Thelohanellus kitauei]|uniref:Uncharacterized protein n=1 Tax=Thelohanellus kitauei TaxID=669202 RepID=A0A0C2NEN4_THEKT|nr:hypothetical protein RF11_09721 [Thelohanellus kitauei]
MGLLPEEQIGFRLQRVIKAILYREGFLGYIENCLRDIEPNGSMNAQCFVIRDNARFHNKCQEICYFLLYSPFLNPKKKAVSKRKGYVKSYRPKKEPELLNL